MGQTATILVGNRHQCVVDLGAKDTLGEELDVLDDPVEFLVGGNDSLARIEEALQATAWAIRWHCTGAGGCVWRLPGSAAVSGAALTVSGQP
jgi:hypothetical protein